MAPISKKSNAGSTAKSGVGTVVSKSGKPGSGFGSGGKNSNVFGLTGKSSKTSSSLSGTVGSGAKSNSTFGSSAKTSSNTFALSGKSSNAPTSKTPSFMPLGTSGKDNSFRPNDKKPTVPLFVGGKTSSVFASSPNKSYPSTSFTSQAKPRTALGIIWIPGRKRNKKKNYVYVPHKDEGYKERSPSMYPHENNL